MHIYQIVPWVPAPFEPRKKPVKERKFFADDEPVASEETARRPPLPVDDDEAEHHTDILA